MTRSRRRSAPAAAAACLGLAAVLLAPPLAGRAAAQTQQSGYVTLRGADTLAVERVERTGDTIRGELRITGVPLTQSYVAEVTRDHRIGRFVLTVRPANAPSSAPPKQRVVLTFQGDTAVLRTGPSSAPMRMGTQAGALPFINLDWPLVDVAVGRARWLRGSSDSTVSVPLFTLAGAHTIAMTVAPLAGDSALITLASVKMRAALDAAGHLVGAKIPAQGLTIRRTGAPSRGAMHPPPRSYSAPPGAPYTARSVRVPSGHHVLACTLTRPKSPPGAVPAVVTITGSGPEDRDESLPGIAGYAIFRQIADTLGRRGIAVLRCDDRGYGRSTGDFAAATSADFANDVRAELAWLRARPGIDARRLALIGHSEGGLIAPMVAATDSSLAGIVLLAGPALPGARILRYQEMQQIEQDTAISPGARDSALSVAMGKVRVEARSNPWLRFFMAYDPLPTARKVRVPVLILQGGTDWQVLPAQAHQLEAAFKTGGDRDVTLHVFPDHDHLFLRDTSGNPAGYATLPSKKVDPRVLGTIAHWLARHFHTR